MKKYLLLLAGLLGFASSSPLFAQIVISQVYSGGGTTGAAYKNDFVELFNRGTSPVAIDGWTVQYSDASFVSWSVVAPLSGTIQPGHYYLVKLSGAGSGTTELPAPDATGNGDLAAEAGRVAVAAGSTNLIANRFTPCTFSGGPAVINSLDYGQGRCTPNSANLLNTEATVRGGNGCLNWLNIAAPAPRNSNSPASPCSTPAITDTKSVLSFGNQLAGTASTAGFTFMNVSLPGDVTISLPAGTPFSLSKEGTAYGHSVTYTFDELTDASYPRGVNVRFAPVDTGFVSATVTLSSPGAAPKTVVLSGRGYRPVVSFASAAARIEEGSESYTIVMNLSVPAESDQTVTIAINDQEGIYGTHYTTNPDGSAGRFSLNIPAGSTEAKFTVATDKNAAVNQDLPITFSVTATSGSVVAGTQKTFMLTVTDQDKKHPDPLESQRLTASPNPTNGALTLSAHDLLPVDTQYYAVVHSNNGKPVFSGKGTLAQLNQQISSRLTTATQGLYTIRLSTDKSVSQVRVVKL